MVRSILAAAVLAFSFSAMANEPAAAPATAPAAGTETKTEAAPAKKCDGLKGKELKKCMKAK